MVQNGKVLPHSGSFAAVAPSDLTLFTAAMVDDAVSFERLCKEGKSLRERQPFYLRTPVHFCCAHNSVKCLRLLPKLVTDKAELADICGMKDWWVISLRTQKNVAHVAAAKGHLDTCLLLFQWFDTGSCDIFEQLDWWGHTPMGWAANQGFADLVELFVVRTFILLVPDGSGIKEVVQARRQLQQVLVNAASAEAETELQRVNEAMIWHVIKAAYLAQANLVQVMLEIQGALESGRFFKDLLAATRVHLIQMLDICKGNDEVRAIVAPIDFSLQDPTWFNVNDGYDPIRVALQRRNMEFIAHHEVTALFMERWDPFGSYAFASKVGSFPFFFLCTMALYAEWLAVLPITCLLRPFFPAVNRWSLRGRSRSTMAYPWHVPFVRWLANYVVLFTWVIIFTMQAVAVDAPENISWREWALLAFACGVIVDECQDLAESNIYSSTIFIQYSSDWWNVFDVACALAYLGYFIIQVTYDKEDETEKQLNLLAAGQNLLAFAAAFIWIRMLALFEVTESIGPLLEALRGMLVTDVTRMLVLVGIIFAGFTCAAYTLFRTICIKEGTEYETCRTYLEGWDKNWPEKQSFAGLVTAMLELEYILWGTTSTSGFEEKEVAGPIFILLFYVIIGVILMNLFIAMLSDTYSNIRAQAILQSRYRRAYTIAAVGSREAIYVPINLVNLTAGALGSLIWYPFTGKPAIRFRKDDPDLPLFLWAAPALLEKQAADIKEKRLRVFKRFFLKVQDDEHQRQWKKQLPELLTRFIIAHEPKLYASMQHEDFEETTDLIQAVHVQKS